MKVKYIYLMEMVITQFEQMMDYLTITRAGSFEVLSTDLIGPLNTDKIR